MAPQSFAWSQIKATALKAEASQILTGGDTNTSRTYRTSAVSTPHWLCSLSILLLVLFHFEIGH